MQGNRLSANPIPNSNLKLEVAAYKKGFADVANSEEMYHYLKEIFVGQVDWDNGGILDASDTLIL